MKIDIKELLNKVTHSHVLKYLHSLPDKCCDVCVTSPPYWGLRDYETAEWIGGDPNCNHSKSSNLEKDISGGKNGQMEGYKAKRVYKNKCGKCGATREDYQLGMEDTPEEFVQVMLEIFTEVRRVLKDHGTLWLNLGDSYWGGKGKSAQAWSTENTERNTLNGKQHQIAGQGETRPSDGKHDKIKPKDLVGIPWAVAFALRDSGWYLRQDIIWCKKNSMPESVTDRCTKAHEYIFLFSKYSKYYYDQEAIRVPLKDAAIARLAQDIANQKGSERAVGKTNSTMKAVIKGHPIGGNGKYTESEDKRHRTKSGKDFNVKMAGGGLINKVGRSGYFDGNGVLMVGPTANKKTTWYENETLSTWRWLFENLTYETFLPLWNKFLEENSNELDIWDISTTPFKDAHFAVFPETLPTICIKAGSSEYGCCKSCGRPWERSENPQNEIGWQPTCNCNGSFKKKIIEDDEILIYSSELPLDKHDIVPAIVLETFSGAGTTPMVAKALGRDFLACELNSKFIKISDKRFYSRNGMFS